MHPMSRPKKGYLLLVAGLVSMLLGFLFEGPTIETSLLFYVTSMVLLLFGIRQIVFGMLEKRERLDAALRRQVQ